MFIMLDVFIEEVLVWYIEFYECIIGLIFECIDIMGIEDCIECNVLVYLKKVQVFMFFMYFFRYWK